MNKDDTRSSSGSGAACENCLGAAIATLYRELWPLRGYDRALHLGLTGAMAGLQRDGVRTKAVVGLVHGREPLYCFLPTVSEADRKQVSTWFEAGVAQHRMEFPGGSESHPSVTEFREDGNRVLVIRDVPWRDDVRLHCNASGSAARNYCGLFFEFRSKKVNGVLVANWKQFCSEAVVPMLFDSFRHRERRMMPFAPVISRKYWDAAGREAGRLSMQPPWDDGHEEGGQDSVRDTVTLSVDLRKSTFCMDQAESQPEFGRWLDRLVQVIISACHKHGGVFDKFTGDGGLMHFLDSECKECVGRSSIEAAFLCAVQLSDDVDGLLPKLRENLRNNSGRLGAGVSIAASEAFWSVDHRDNPIVVGHGVVDACRICDGTPPRTIRMSNLAYRRLAAVNEPFASLFREVELGATKEWTPEMQLKVWQMTTG